MGEKFFGIMGDPLPAREFALLHPGDLCQRSSDTELRAQVGEERTCRAPEVLTSWDYEYMPGKQLAFASTARPVCRPFKACRVPS